MPQTRSRRTTRLTDEQIRERIGCMVERPSKTGYLTAAVFAFSVFALALSGAFPPAFKDIGAWAAKVLWVINLIWTLVAAFGWKSPLTDWELKHLSEEQQHRHSRLGTIWFRVWKGGYLALASMVFLLLGLGLLRATGWVGILAVGGYLLSLAASFWQRRRLLRVVIEGWSADTRWGRLMLLLAAIGSAAGASVGSGTAIVLVRLHILPENVLLAYAGVWGILVADMVIPQVVQDFSVAWIHLRIHRLEANQTGEGG